MKHLDQRFFLDISGADTEAEAIRLNQINGYSIAAAWGANGGRAGELKLQVSNDYYFRWLGADTQDPQEIINGDNNANALWVDVPGSTKVVGAGADSHLWNVSEAFYAAVRMVWVETTGGGGTDEVTAVIHGQGYSL